MMATPDNEIEARREALRLRRISIEKMYRTAVNHCDEITILKTTGFVHEYKGMALYFEAQRQLGEITVQYGQLLRDEAHLNWLAGDRQQPEKI